MSTAHTSSTRKPHHSSSHSQDSTHPLPSLCSSISSYNSSSKSLPIHKMPSAEDVSVIQNDNKPRKRWDDSQFAIELCDDHLLKKTHSKHSERSNHHQLKKKLSIKLFIGHELKTSGNSSSNSSSSSSSSSNSRGSRVHSNRLSNSIRKLKSIMSL